MTACYLVSVLWHWKKSPNPYAMLRICPRFMTNDWVFALLSTEDKVFTPWFQSVRAMPTLPVKHEIHGSSVARLNLLSSGFDPLDPFPMVPFPTMPWHRHIHAQSALCCRRMTLLHRLHRHPDYRNKLDRAGECSWSWKCDRLYCETVWTVPGAISACY